MLRLRFQGRPCKMKPWRQYPHGMAACNIAVALRQHRTACQAMWRTLPKKPDYTTCLPASCFCSGNKAMDDKTILISYPHKLQKLPKSDTASQFPCSRLVWSDNMCRPGTFKAHSLLPKCHFIIAFIRQEPR